MVKDIRKKLLKTIFLITIIVMIIIPKQEIAASNIMLGDINDDKIVDSRDMLAMLRHIATKVNKKHPEWELKKEKLEAADVTKDEKVDAEDMLLVLRYIAASNSETIKKKHPEWIEFKKKETVKEIKEEETKQEEKTKPEQETKQETKQEKTKQEETKRQEEQTTKLEPKTIEVTEIKIDKTKLEIEEEKTEKLTAIIEPTNATNQKITYSSSNTNIVTVDDNGNIKGIKAGTAIITAKSDNGKTATSEVTVKAKAIEVEKVEINKKSIELDMSGTKTVTLKATITPNTATDKTITWTSSNKEIATVDNKTGKVTAKKNGTAQITVKSNNGKTATCKVTVKTSPTSVKLNKTTLSLNLVKTKTATLTATISPKTASNKSVIYSSSNTKVAVVDKKTGKVTAKAKGKAVITVKTTSNNKSAKCTVTVSGGYWEAKSGKYIYHYLNGTTKTWTVSEYEGWKKLKEKNVKAIDPKTFVKKGNMFTFAGITQKYYVEDNTANNIAIKNGGSPYAITVDLNRRHESIFKINKGDWEPYKSAEVHVGKKWTNYNSKGCPDLKTYTKNSVTPTGLFYITGNRNNGKGLYWVGFGVQYKNKNLGAYGVNGHGPNKEDYLHSGEGKNYTVKKGGPCTNGCVVSSLAHAKWIYFNCGRGTPVLIY